MTAENTQLPYNPRILKWARERSGMGIDDVAKKINVTVERISDWESGKSKPTIRQGRMLADSYGRHFLEFFADAVPEFKEIQLAPDFRTFSDRESQGPKEFRALKIIQEWAEEQRLNAIALIDEMGDTPPKFSENLKFNINTDVEVAAAISREAMHFRIEDQLSIKNSLKYTFPEILRDKIENMGILVLKQSGITKLGARGICLFADPMPVIVFGSEAPGAQAFTLAHEFGHALIGESGVSGQPRFGGKTGFKAIEDWCNKFASAFLAPSNSIEKILTKPESPAKSIDLVILENLADKFAMSRHAMLIRLVGLGYVQSKFYWKTMRPVFLKEEKEYKSFGRSQYYGKRYINSKGRYYTGLVMSAWSGGLISAHNAAEYMGINNFKHLREIREDYGF